MSIPQSRFGAGLIGELNLEASEIDLALDPRRRLEADLERLDLIGTHLLDCPLDPGVAASEAQLAQLAAETDGSQPGVGRQPITHIGQERVGGLRLWCPRAVSRRFEAEGDIPAHRLAVDPQLATDGSEAQPLAMQFHDHDQFPNPNHRIRLQQTEATWMDTQRSGEFSTPTSGEHSPPGDTRSLSRAVLVQRIDFGVPTDLGIPSDRTPQEAGMPGLTPLPDYLDSVLTAFTDETGRAELFRWLRRPEDCMTAPRLSAMKSTRLSFASLLARRIIEERWSITRERFHCDVEGEGHGVYKICAGAHTLTYLARFYRWDGIEKAGRRSDGANRDMFGAIFLGEPDEARIAQELASIDLRDVDRMRTNADVTGWTPASRSARFFDHVVDSLAAGRQPDPAMLGSGAGYLLRNGGYLGSGRQGSRAFEGIPADHPFRHPFFADLFGLFLIRQVSIDLVNEIAAERSPYAAKLAPELARYIGVGNSSGQGMCVALQRWPEWVSTWITVREMALAYAKSQPANAEPQRAQRLSKLLARASAYYASIELPCEDYVVRTEVLAANLSTISGWVAAATQSNQPWGKLAERVAASFDPETVEQLHALLIEIYPEFADALAPYIAIGARQDRDIAPEMRVGALRELLRTRYDWALTYDMRKSKTRQHFWYHSIDNGEQRRGERVIDPHEQFESFIDHIGLIQRLAAVLTAYPDKTQVAELLADIPDLFYAVARVQYLARLPFAEIRDNLLHCDFLPAHLIRFFLSVLGIVCTSPLSIRYVRGVFFQGMPLPEEIARGASDDWMFPLLPQAATVTEDAA